MQLVSRLLALSLLAGISLSPVHAADQAVCDEQRARLEEKLEIPGLSDNAREYLQNLHTTITQTCGFIDNATLRKMVSSVDTMLPLVDSFSVAAAPQEPAKTAPAPASEVSLPASATASDLLSTIITRDDPMFGVVIADWDLYKNTARVLFYSQPSRLQFNHPQRGRYVYVAEIGGDGAVQLHALGKRKLEEIVTMALRRGFPEVVVQSIDPAGNLPAQLERWSIPERRKVAVADAPGLPWSRAKPGEEDLFSIASSDGNLVFVNAELQDEVQGVAWLESTPDGTVIGSGHYFSPGAKALPTSLFHTNNGGAGVLLDVLADDDAGVETELETPVRLRMGAHSVTGVVGNERRLLVIDNDARGTWESAALDRTMMWLDMDKLPAKAPLDELLQRTRQLQQADMRYGANHSVASTAVGARHVPAVVPLADGYAALVRNNNHDSEQQAFSGDWLFEYMTDGEVRKTYIEPISARFDGRFASLAASADGQLYAYAAPAIVQFDRQRKPVAFAELEIPPAAQLRTLLADAKGVWVIGVHYPSGRNQSIWLARLNIDAAASR